MAKKTQKKSNVIERPPVVVVMGHIDHGKSTLLDFIRKSNIVDGEAGGITQHLSGYEVTHKGEDGSDKTITFLDTPGHEAFGAMRSRGASVADIAVLVVSAEDGVKAQTLEALKSIKEAEVPFIIAINKIDKPGANVEQTKSNLVENEIYVEGFGGDIPSVPISAKEGTGVPDLLDTILLVAELEELTGDAGKSAEGVVIESTMDPQKGISATILIKDGTLKKGEFVVAGGSVSPVRIMENFAGNNLDTARFSSPVRIIGWNTVPEVGSAFVTFSKKKDAEKASLENGATKSAGVELSSKNDDVSDTTTIPLVIKTDVAGSADAIVHEIEKLFKEHERIIPRIVHSGVGNISENDLNMVGGIKNPIVIGFNVKVDNKARDIAERLEINVQTFDVIYKIAEYLGEIAKDRTPKIQVDEKTGHAKVIRIFSQTKNAYVLGGKVTEGKLKTKGRVKILRRDVEIGRGVILELQSQKLKTDEIPEGTEFGGRIETKTEVAEGDTLEGFTTVTK